MGPWNCVDIGGCARVLANVSALQNSHLQETEVLISRELFALSIRPLLLLL